MKSEKILAFKENPALIKLELLVNGVNIRANLNLNENEAPERYIYDSSKNTDLNVPSEIILPKNIVSNIFFSEESPWLIKERRLFYKNTEICTIKFTPESNFSKHKLLDGSPASKFVVMYGLDVLAIFLNKYCTYFKNKEGCHFCSAEYNIKHKGKDNPIKLRLDKVIETFKLALEMDYNLFNYVMISSGAYPNPNNGILSQMKYIQNMRNVNKGKNKKYHLVTIPPTSNELLHMLAEEGPETVAFDIEIFDPDLFKKYCLGKEKQIGYERFLRIFEDASKIFQKNRVKAGFVCGLESRKSIINGMKFFGRLGIPSSLNIFHPDRGSKLENYPIPSSDYLSDVLIEQSKINDTYSLIPIFPEFGRRSSLDTEVYRGFFNDISH